MHVWMLVNVVCMYGLAVVQALYRELLEIVCEVIQDLGASVAMHVKRHVNPAST